MIDCNYSIVYCCYCCLELQLHHRRRHRRAQNYWCFFVAVAVAFVDNFDNIGVLPVAVVVVAAADTQPRTLDSHRPWEDSLDNEACCLP